MREDTEKVFIKNFGCQMNVRDSEVICGLLKNAGYEITAEPDKADIVLFNTCSVRQHAEDKVWSEVGRYKEKSTRAHEYKGTRPIIGVIGCMAQNYKERIFERAPNVDFVVGPSDIYKIPEILAKFTRAQGDMGTRQFFEVKIWETDSSVRPEEIYHTNFYAEKSMPTW